MRRRSILGGILGAMASTTALARGFFLGGGGGGATPTLTDITLTNNTFPGGAASGTPVGTLAVVSTGGSFSGTLSQPGGANGANFQTVASVLETNGVLAAGPYPDVEITATQAGAIGSPLTRTFSITGTSATVIGGVTMQDLSGATRTNTTIPFRFVYPFAPGQLTAGQIVQVFDGSTQLDVQEDTRSTDRSGNVRLVTGVAMWRSATLAANSAKAFTIKVAGGSILTGTAITNADILATDYDVGATFTFPDGTLYKAAARDILITPAAWSGTNNNGNPQQKGTYATGPFMTEFVGSTPLINQTTMVAHPHLRAQVHIQAFKGATGAVSGGNPILYIRTYFKPENGYLFVASPADLVYGAAFTVGFASPVAITSDANNPGNIDLTTQTPAATLTIGSPVAYEGIATQVTATRSAGTWTKDDIGRIIEDIATGRRMRIWSLTNSTTVLANNYAGAGLGNSFTANTFSTAIASGSYTTGNWKQYGVCHLNMANWYVKVWWGANADHMSIPDWAQITGSKVFPNWSAPIGNYAPANMSNLDTQGVPATRYKRPARGIGDFQLDLDTGGQTDTERINIVPNWFHRLCQLGTGVSWSDNDRRKAEENAQAWMSLDNFFRYEATGDLIDFTDTGVPLNNLYWYAGSTHKPTMPTTRMAFWYWRYSTNDTSHATDAFMPMWMLTGDYIWLEAQQLYAQSLWTWVSNAVPGNSRGPLRDAFNGICQDRGVAWWLRSWLHALMMTPDGFALSIHTKAVYEAVLDGQMSFAVTNFVNDTTNWSADGPKVLQKYTPSFWDSWQSAFNSHVMIHAKENNLLDANGLSYFDWYLTQPMAVTSTSGANTLNSPYYMAGTYDGDIIGSTTGKDADKARLLSFASFYEVAAKDPGTYADYGNNYNAHGRTITAVSGPANARVLTFDAAYFLPVAPDNAWYVGGWVRVQVSGTFTAIGLITAVSADGTQVTVDSTVTTPTYLLAGIAFSASSYATSTNILLPLPRAGLWPHATVFSQGDYIGRQLTEAAYFIRQSGPAAALQDMHVAEPSKYADAAAAWAFYKTHWEVDGGLGVGVLTSDIGAPNNTSGTRWGSNGTGMLITPRI